MSIYTDLAPVAASILSQFKQGTINLVKVTPGAGPIYDPGDPVEVSYSVDAVVTGVNKEYVDGELVLASDLQVIVPTTAPQPDITDYIDVDSKRHQIVRVENKPPAGDRVVTICVIRKR